MPEYTTRTISYASDLLTDILYVRQKYLEAYSSLQMSSASGGGDVCSGFSFRPRHGIIYLRVAKEGYETAKISKGRGATRVSVLIPATAQIPTLYENASGRSDFICMDLVGEKWSSVPLAGVTPQRMSSSSSEHSSGSYSYTMDGINKETRLPVSTEIAPGGTKAWMEGLPGFSDDAYCYTGRKGDINPRHLIVKWRKPGDKTAGHVVRKMHIAKWQNVQSAIQTAKGMSPSCISYQGESVRNWSPE